MELGGKKLVVKVDAKTKTVLDEYKADRRRKLRGRSPLQDETPDENDYIDEAMKHSDALAMERITATMEDYESDMNNYSGPVGKGDRSRSDSKDRKMSKTQEKLLKLSQGQGPGHEVSQDSGLMLDDVDIEEGKRDLITREIGKFREIMKKQEEEKEVERDGAESLRNESLVSEQLHLVETEIETGDGIETIGLALVRRPHPIVPRHIHGQGHEAENLVAAHHQEAVRIQIKYDRRAETVVDGHIPGIEKGS